MADHETAHVVVVDRGGRPRASSRLWTCCGSWRPAERRSALARLAHVPAQRRDRRVGAAELAREAVQVLELVPAQLAQRPVHGDALVAAPRRQAASRRARSSQRGRYSPAILPCGHHSGAPSASPRAAQAARAATREQPAVDDGLAGVGRVLDAGRARDRRPPRGAPDAWRGRRTSAGDTTASPAAQVRSQPSTRPSSPATMKPSSSAGSPSMRRARPAAGRRRHAGPRAAHRRARARARRPRGARRRRSCSSTPALRSSSATASLASSPNSDSGAPLRRDDRDADVVVAHVPRLAGGHQRELVGGQRPDRPGRHDDRDPLRVALVNVAQQAAVDLGIAARPPGRRALDAGAPHARRERRAARRTSALPPRAAAPRRGRRRRRPSRRCTSSAPASSREPRERHAVRVAERERLGDRERPVRELGVGRDQRQVDPIARERAQGQQAFEACDTTAGDHDVHRSAPYTLLRESRSRLRAFFTDGLAAAGLRRVVGCPRPCIPTALSARIAGSRSARTSPWWIGPLVGADAHPGSISAAGGCRSDRCGTRRAPRRTASTAASGRTTDHRCGMSAVRAPNCAVARWPPRLAPSMVSNEHEPKDRAMASRTPDSQQPARLRVGRGPRRSRREHIVDHGCRRAARSRSTRVADDRPRARGPGHADGDDPRGLRDHR